MMEWEEAMILAENLLGTTLGAARSKRTFLARLTAASLVAVGVVLAPGLSGGALADDRDDAPPVPWTGPVPKAHCGPHDHVESGLQGSTTLAERFGGAAAQGFNCNLELVGQFRGEGTSWQMAWFGDCAYYDTANTAGQQHFGTVIVDVADPHRPNAVGYINTVTMRDPWESLHVNKKRKLLGGGESENGTGIGGGFEVYDASDCRHPLLKSSIELPNSHGHAGNFSQDGLTFYETNGFRGVGGIMPMVDVSDPADARWLLNWQFNGNGRAHDTNTNADGTREYSPQPGFLTAPVGSSSFGPEGLVILDVSDVKNRLSNPQVRIVSTLFWQDGGQAQQALPVTIKGKPYLIFTQELGSAGAGASGRAFACAQNLPPFGFTKIIDISDEKNPREVAKLMLEVHDPANCATTLQEALNPVFVYDSHYCNVDDPRDAKVLACSYFEAGLRVFDIHDPFHPREIAYFKAPAQGTKVIPGSNLWNFTGGRSGTVFNRTADWASSFIRFHKYHDELHLWFTSQDNGFLVVKFTNELARLGDVVGDEDADADERDRDDQHGRD
jgi:hypothetical protein